ncbi:MAG: serine/threonine protein kinase [Deltaproteobacteria bacterium]|nr:serine/threonine protein kinase [Deltaproteobacteria bacterium]
MPPARSKGHVPPPRAIGPYEIGGRIASGGMADVFVGRKLGTTGGAVAIKRPRRDMVSEPGFVKMFLDEARLAFHVKSVHTVQVLDLGTDDDGAPYYVMPLVVGSPLAKLLPRGPIDPALAIEIAAQSADGLHDAHIARDDRGNELAIVHRDVSPQNILLDVEGRVRIADFGVARAAQRMTRSRTGQVKGKVGYLSPEQARAREVDRRSDVFSLGIVLWEMLTGVRLFKAKNLVDVHHRLLVAPIPHPSATLASIPREVGDVVLEALERDLDRRIADAATFAERLRAIAPRRVHAEELGQLVRVEAASEVARLEAIARAVSSHHETLHTLSLPMPPDDGGDLTPASGSDAHDTIVTPPPTESVEPATGFLGWLGRLLRGRFR